MSDATNYTEEQIINWMSQGVAPDTPPDPLYVSLHTADPGETLDGSTEVGASEYNRQSVGSSGWETYTSGDASGFRNLNDIQFPEATSSWGTISHVAIWDGSANTDNALASYGLSVSKSIDDGDQAVFTAQGLTFETD